MDDTRQGEFGLLYNEYIGLTESELEQFAEVYYRHEKEKAQSPVVQNLLERIKKWEETQMKTKGVEAAQVEKHPAMIAVQEIPVTQTLLPELPKTGTEKNGMTLAETMTLGEVLYKSRFYNDIQSAHQAVAKVLAGRELGLGPMVALSKIFVVGGKIAIQAEVMADLIKRGQKYDYRVIGLTNEKCEIHFFENGKKVGESTFSLEDARRADVLKGVNWQKYPRNMLFSRALANGARWYCPDAIHGAYTYDEMGLEVGADGAAFQPKPEIVIEPEVVPASKPAEKKTLSRAEQITELVTKHGKEKMKKIKEKMEIKEKLQEVGDAIWARFVKEVEK